MSIIKNNSGTGDNLRTIKVLSQVDGYDINKYVHLENCGYHLGYVSNSSFYVMMRCELPSGATGYLFGIKNTSGTSGDFYVKCDATTITWAIGSDTWTRARESGVHEYGFVDGKPVYDNALVSTTAVAHSGIHAYTMCIGGVHKTDNTYEYISAINLYRFNARYYAVASPTSSSIAWLGAFYPTSTTLRNARKVPEASLTIYHNDGATFSNNASTEAVTYGVQLDDLRDITESGFCDLLAILAEDNGVDTGAGWDGEGDATGQADVSGALTKTGQPTINTAFFLGKNGMQVPLPSGWSAGTQSTYGYVLGELMRGRKPKWDIWNDALKCGFYIDYNGSQRVMRFNILKIMDLTGAEYGTKDGVRLEWFENYNTDKTVSSHPPKLEVISPTQQADLYMHNGAFVRCLEGDVVAGIPGGSYNVTQYVTDTVKDDGCVFDFTTMMGKLRFVAGNLVPWNYTKAEMQSKQWVPKGAKMTVQLGHPYTSQDYYAQAIEKADPTDDDVSLIDPNFPDARKALFQSTGFEVDLELVKNKWQLLDYFDKYGNNATMSAIMNILSDVGDIDCSRLVPAREFQVRVTRDANIIQGSSKYRMVVDYVDETDSSKIGLVRVMNGGYFGTRLDGSDYDGTAIAVPFIPVKLENGVWVPDYTKNSVEYIALFEYYSTNNDTEYDTHFCILPIVKGVDAYKAGGTYKTNVANSVWINNSQDKYVWTKGETEVFRYLIGRNTQAMTDLADNIRMMSAFRPDFDVQSMPSDATVIAHIYNKATAPFFVKAGTWYASQHISRDSIGSGTSLRHLAFTRYCYMSDSAVKFTFKFLPYNSEYKISNMGDCVLTVKKNGTNYGKFTVSGYTPYPQDYNQQPYSGYSIDGKNMSGTTISGFHLDMYNNAVADELLFGLDNSYWGSAYFGAEITFPNGAVSGGDFIEIDFN